MTQPFTLILPQEWTSVFLGFGFLLMLHSGDSDWASQQSMISSFLNPQIDFLNWAFSFSDRLDTPPMSSILAHHSGHLLIETQVCSSVHLFRAQCRRVAHKSKTTLKRWELIFEILSTS